MQAYRRLKMYEGEAMPAHRPYYPALPSHYRDVEFQYVYFRTDPAVIREHLPEPLEPDPQGMAVAFSIKVPFCSAYGPFNEAGLCIACTFRGQPAYFNSHLYLDNVSAICSGRERWGAPKEFAQVEIAMKGNLLYSQTVKEGTPIMTITSDLSQAAQAEEIIPMFPTFRLKLIPRADSPEAEIKQLVTAEPEDVEVKLVRKGNGMVTFGSSANSDLTCFQPKEIVAAFYQVATYTETYGKIAYDYLTEAK